MSTVASDVKIGSNSFSTSQKSSYANEGRKTKSTLSSKELLDRRARGQCFHCDELYHPGKECKTKLYMMKGELEEEEQKGGKEVTDVLSEMEELLSEECIPAEISINALSGNNSLSTIRMQGKVKNQGVSILIDSGSTHSFIDTILVKHLGLVADMVSPLSVTVADGNSNIVDSACRAMKFTIQGHEFVTDLRLYPLGGSDIILGVDWLQQVNPVTFDFKKHKISIEKGGKMIDLQGKVPAGGLQAITSKELKKLFNKKGAIPQGCICVMTGVEDAGEGTKDTQIAPLLRQLVDEYREVFEEPKGLPPARKYDHHIPLLENTQPINQRSYKVPYIQKAEIERQIQEMLQTGVIQESTSPFASPVILVKKKDGTWRMCVDYRKLNDATIKNKYPIPIIDELLDELKGASWFTKLDLRAGYHQIRVAKEDIYKTAFRTHQGLYEFKVMPFGLTNAPATFQALMNSVFQEELRKHVLVFFDDILVYSSSLEEHYHHLMGVLEKMKAHQLYAKRSKCFFGQQQLEYLGHLISQEGVSTDPEKIKVMQEWPTPKNVKQLRGFLGLTGYYWRFVKDYGLISRPLTRLLKKGAYLWDQEADMTFKRLKEAMTSTPVLTLPDYGLPFVVETDASDVGLGAVLMQQGRPIAFLSKALAPRHQSYSTYEKELLALVLATTKWYHYLQGHHFIVKTDHQSLKLVMKANCWYIL